MKTKYECMKDVLSQDHWELLTDENHDVHEVQYYWNDEDPETDEQIDHEIEIMIKHLEQIGYEIVGHEDGSGNGLNYGIFKLRA